MTRTTNQSGFAVVEALLVVIILAIVGFTGWFVWHSKQSVDATLSNTGTSTNVVGKKKAATKPAETLTTQIVAPASVNVALTYPKTWKVTHSGGPYSTQIVGPSGDVYVDVEGLGGLGGACDPTDPQSGTIKSVQVTTLNNPKFSLATYTSQAGSDSPTVASELVPASDIAKFKVGSSACDVYLNNILTKDTLGKQSATDPNIFNTSVSIRSKAIADQYAAGSKPTSAQINTFLASDDFEAATTIIKSFSYE